MWLVWIVLIVVIVLAVKMLIGNSSANPGASEDESPLSILKKRYARGEIDDDEFKRRSRELEK